MIVVEFGWVGVSCFDGVIMFFLVFVYLDFIIVFAAVSKRGLFVFGLVGLYGGISCYGLLFCFVR